MIIQGKFWDRQPGWQVGETYKVGQMRRTDAGDIVRCKAPHVASAANQPTSGAQWATYWTFLLEKVDTHQTIYSMQSKDPITHPPIVEGDVRLIRSGTLWEASGLIQAKTVAVAGDRTIIELPYDGVVKIGEEGSEETYVWTGRPTLDLSLEADWDTVTGTDYTVAANRAGFTPYIYAEAPASGSTPVFKLSANSTVPFGKTAANSRKAGGGHCLCADVKHTGATGSLAYWTANTAYALGTTIKDTADSDYIYRCTVAGTSHATDEPVWAGIAVGETIADGTATFIKELHALEGYPAGALLPGSVWCLDFRPTADLPGLVYIPGTNAWVMIYQPSGTYPNLVSANGGTVAHNLTTRQYILSYRALNMRLPSIEEFQLFAAGSNENTPWSGGAGTDPTTTGGLSDPYGRRLVSYFGIEDCCGHHAQLTMSRSSVTSFFSGGGAYATTAANIGPYGTQNSGGAIDVSAISNTGRGVSITRNYQSE